MSLRTACEVVLEGAYCMCEVLVFGRDVLQVVVSTQGRHREPVTNGGGDGGGGDDGGGSRW